MRLATFRRLRFVPTVLECSRTRSSSGPTTQRHLSSSSSSSSSSPIVELREYEFYPSKASLYQEVTSQRSTQQSPQRQAVTPLRCALFPDTGGVLNQALLFYHFAEGYAERDRVKGQLRPEDRDYSRKVKECCMQQRSAIFVEAPLVKEMGLCGLAQGNAEEQFGLRGSGTSGVALLVQNTTIFEIRRYQLQLGYDTVPQFLNLYRSGLPSKLQAPGTDPTTSLITVLYSEVGQLNEVIEVWRHGDGTAAMEASRVAARGASEWRTAIGEIAGIANVFTNTIVRPYNFSNIR